MADKAKVKRILNTISAMAEVLSESEIEDINKVIQRAIVRMGKE